MTRHEQTRRAARNAARRVHTDARRHGFRVTSFAVRAQAESAVRAVWERAYARRVAPVFRPTLDRKTASLGSTFALSSCSPTAACAVYCYVLHNVACGLNTPAAIAKAVENTLAVERDAEAAAEAYVASARRRGVTLRLATGGEAPPAFVAAVARRVPTRLLFSCDATTRRVPDGALRAYMSDGAADVPNGTPHVVFRKHRGRHHATPPADVVNVCPATASNGVCGVTCFRCFPESTNPGDAVVAWGFTRKPATWQHVASEGVLL